MKYWRVLVLAIPFVVMDLFMRLLGHEVKYFTWRMVIPNIMFIAIWIGLILGIVLSVRRRLGKIIYWTFFLLYFVFFLTNCIYYSLTGYFFNFNLISMAGEGSAYILDTILNTSPFIWLMCVAVIVSAVLSFRAFPKEQSERERHGIKRMLQVVGVFVILHICTPFLMGFANESLEWDTWRNPRNVYNNWSDANKNMKICGIYEFVFRDLYMTYLKAEEKVNPDDPGIQYLAEVYQELSVNGVNDYTGIFEGKNVIFLQLEGMDSWLLNEEDTPNLYALMNNSLVFNNHYSYYSGGGSTFNSELAVNTGLITPISYTQNAYTFNRNLFDHSLAALFKEQGYSVNAFHMNTREYYSRGINYDNWGYDHYYGLLDENSYQDLSYELDRELILNSDFYERMFLQEGSFVHYIITYTPHTPFTTEKGMGQLLAEMTYEGEEIPDLTEEESARLYASETDLMVGMLMQALMDNGLYENTVIVAYADHYLYTLNDKTVLEQYKITENNLINHTPFFIWSSDMERTDINKVNSQIDILPTVLNLFGIEYVPEYYIGRDIFDADYSGYVFFSDYSWYDGNVYVEDGIVANDKAISEEKLNEMNTLINNLIQKNDMTLKHDYYRELKKEQAQSE